MKAGSFDKKNLISRLLRRGVVLQLLTAWGLFGPARTFDFWQAWAFLGVQWGAMLWTFVYFYERDPQMLERRMLRQEPMTGQRILIALWRILAGVALVLAGADHRYGWTRAHFGPVPAWLELFSLALVLCGHILVFLVMRANRFAASVIQIEAGQTVAVTGPYRLVRHPMYLGFLGMWLFMATALGSYFALPPCLLIFLIVVLRLLNEEKMLRRDLPGYTEFCQRTTRRLIPFVW